MTSHEKDPVLFHIGDILSVIHGRQLSLAERPALPNGEIPPKRENAMDGISEILEFMTKAKLVQGFATSNSPSIKRFSDDLKKYWDDYIFKKDKTRQENIQSLFGNPKDLARRITSTDRIDAWDIMRDFFNAVEGTQCERIAQIYGKPARQTLWDSFLKLGEAKDNFKQHGFQQILTKWNAEVEQKIGKAYLAVTPLDYYQELSSEQELRRIHPNANVIGMDMEGGQIINSLFPNVPLEDAMRMVVKDYVNLAQALLAVANHHEIGILPQQIQQQGAHLHIGLGTGNIDEAQERYDKFLGLLPQNIHRFATLDYQTQEDQNEYTISFDAGAMQKKRGNAPSAEDKLINFAAQLTGAKLPSTKQKGS